MFNGKKILAIIPARSGSKGLPGKNIKEINGKPLISWSIAAGLKSKYIDHLMVTTDGGEIAEIARNSGAEVPFLRPPELSGDDASSFMVVEHVVTYYKEQRNETFDYLVLLEPTSPLRETSDIDTPIEMLLQDDQGAESIVGICKTECQNPAFLVRKDSGNFLSGYDNGTNKVLRRQEISDVYFFEGSIYVSEINSYLENKTFYHEKTIGYEVPKWKSIEIDDIYDFVMAESIMKWKEYKI